METSTPGAAAPTRDASPVVSLDRYLDLMDSFLSGERSADDFERRYLTLFKSDDADRSPTVFAILDGLFADVDAYYPDPALRGPDDLDEEQLRRRVAAARAALTGAAPRRHRRVVADE